jgi:thioredoxin-like negative regulator of GroEL
MVSRALTFRDGRPGLRRRMMSATVDKTGPQIAFGIMQDRFVSYTELIESDCPKSEAKSPPGMRSETAAAKTLTGTPCIRAMMGTALGHHRAGRFTEAAQIYRQILAIDAQQADSLHLLGMIAYQDGRLEAAVDMIRQAIAINKDEAAYYSNLGTVLQAQGGLDEAAACYERALALKPGLAEVHTNLGNILKTQGKADDSVACHERALALQPGLAEAHYNLGLVQLLKGDFPSGWRNFEWRWRTKEHCTPMRAYPQPLWSGEKLACGRLLIWREQGVGDEIMFAGLIPDVSRSGNRCLLECERRLKPLFARSFPGIEVVSGRFCGNDPGKDAANNPELDIAAHLPSGSLPRLFRANFAAFAATTSPYLIAEPVARERFRARYSDGRRLAGLAWHTNRKAGRNRCIDLALFAPLFARTDIRWVSLQYGDHDALRSEVTVAGAPVFIDGSVDQFSDIDLFAAQVAAMDLVLTIDNSTAHLAGALGVPTWVLLPFAPDWRWLQAGEDSLWYPTLRLFRQPQRGAWQPVVQAVQGAL